MNRGRLFFISGIAAALIFGWIVFPSFLYESFSQPVQFSHAAHTGDNVGMSCGDCHVFEDDGRYYSIPASEKCSECHSKSMGVSVAEEKMVSDYLNKGKNIPWIVYSEQPENVYFSHATHVKVAGIECRSCHFGHEFTHGLRPARFNRISGYSLDVLGGNLLDTPPTPSKGMRMDDCVACHHSRGIKEGCIDCHK